MSMYDTILAAILGASFVLAISARCHRKYKEYWEDQKKKDENLEETAQGKTSKVEYKGHSYVVWAINSGGGIVHDPDCRCQNNDKWVDTQKEIKDLYVELLKERK